jgi:hypothetical protein
MNERYARMVLAAIFFVYVLWIRTYDVASTFLMLGEQTRDWTIALGGVTDLPLVGAPSTAGGRGFGPAYYWLLWLGRVTLGPFMDNVPHAGGITVALLQSIADAWLLFVLARRVHWTLALAMCLLIASAPFDIAISSVIWNPPVSAALIKMATAMALTLTASSPRWHAAVTATLAWLAVQAHLSAIFVAAPMLIAVGLQPLIDKPKGLSPQILKRVGIVACTIVLLQIPFVISILREPSAPVGPSSAIASLTNPQVIRPWQAYDSVTSITGNLLVPISDRRLVFAIVTLILGSIVAFAYRRDPVLLGASIGGVVMATLLFTTSTRGYDGYWFLTLTTALTLTFGMAIAAIPSKPAVKWIGIALLLLIALRQPARIADSTRFFKYPQYETMLKASRALIMQAPVVRDIRVTFDVHPTMDRHFIYTILGGRIDPRALYTAVVRSDGSVSLE